MTSLLIALALTVVVFPEVIFLGSSLSHAGLADVIEPNDPDAVVRPFRHPEDLPPEAGGIDIGAQAWQLDPATKFMQRAFAEGESPVWNPYAAAGSLGPETLADIKFSPFVVMTAVFGASSNAFTFVLLAFVVLGLYCLQQFFVRTLEMGRLAAVAACVGFILGGWATSLVSSQMGAPYLLFPVVLYALAEFLRVTRPVRYLLALGAYGLMLLTTFLPVVLLVLILVHAIALVVDATRRQTIDEHRPVVGRVGVLLGRQAIVPAGALLVTAVVWLPILDAYRNAGPDITGYNARVLKSKDPLEFLTLLTPRHIYRSYLVETIPPRVRTHPVTVTLGIVPLLLIAAALPRSRNLARRLLILSVVLGGIAVAQHMNVPGLDVIGGLPVLRTVANTYWMALAAAALTIGVGVAINVAARDGLSWRSTAIVSGGFAVAFAIGVATNWRPSTTALISVTVAVVTIVAFTVLTWFSGRSPGRTRVFAVLALALMAVELLSYQNHVRVKRVDYEDDPPAYLEFVRTNVGNERVLNAGRGALYPEWGSAFGIRQVETINVMQIPAYRAFFERYLNPMEGRSKFLATGSDTNIDFAATEGALDQLSVRYLIVADDLTVFQEQVALTYPLVFEDPVARVKVYENVDAFPRTYVSSTLLSEAAVSSSLERWSMDRAFTMDEELLAEGEVAGLTDSPSAVNVGDATIVADHHTSVRVDVDAAQAAVLVLTDVFHKNWSVTVNGESAHLARVNDVVRGVIVPAGESVVEFRYESVARSIGWVISLVSFALLLTAILALSWRDRRSMRSRGRL